MLWKRYALVLGIGLIVANGYTFWPALAYANTLIHCPAIFGVLSYDVKGASQVVGAPLYSEMQLIIHPGSTAFETAIYRSDANNLTRLFQDYPTVGSVTHDLPQIDGFDGLTSPVPANQAGVTITFENKTFESIHVADLLYSIKVGRFSNRCKLRDRRGALLDRARIDGRKVTIFRTASIRTDSANWGRDQQRCSAYLFDDRLHRPQVLLAAAKNKFEQEFDNALEVGIALSLRDKR